MIALLSNPHASGNLRLLPKLAAWAARQDDIDHQIIERVEDIGPALARAAALKPDLLVLNGGDGTARAFLSELYHGDYFADVPPVAVLPSGKTNLIAIDLGAGDDPFGTLKRLVARHRRATGTVVRRSLLALFTPGSGNRPVLGLFVGGAGLAETILYCRRHLYPTGLPNAVCHALAAVIALFAVLTGGRFGWSPVRDRLRVRTSAGGADDRFFVLLVTTLERLLLGVDVGAQREGARGGLKLIAVNSRPATLARAAWAVLTGRFGKAPLPGVTLHGGDEVRIEGRGALVLDGESYAVPDDGALVLRSTAPMPFVSLA